MLFRWFCLAILIALTGLLAPETSGAAGVHTCRKGSVVTYTNLPCNKQHGSIGKNPASKSKEQDVYYKHHKDGVVVFSSKPPRGVRYETVLVGTCYACGIHSSIDWNRIALNTDDYEAEITAAAAEFGVDIALIRALIHAESAFNRLALSRKGAQGLMQLMPATADIYGVTDAFDAGQNIRAGVQHLAMLLKRYKGNLELVTAAYNAGEGAVAKYKGTVPPYAETQVYVQRVEKLRQRYTVALTGNAARS